uniref:Chemokine interleukin-8-like domain-containing protein n=1 Tax=Oreochromis aureus TaxID=47969 RepID=A0A668VFB7_OREAU
MGLPIQQLSARPSHLNSLDFKAPRNTSGAKTHLHSPGNSVRLGMAEKRCAAPSLHPCSPCRVGIKLMQLFLCVTFSAPISIKSCCVSWSRTRVPLDRIVNYTIQTEEHCRIKAVQLRTVHGNTICANPDADWTKKAMEWVDKKKEKPALATSAPTTSAPTTSTPTTSAPTTSKPVTCGFQIEYKGSGLICFCACT